MSFVTIDLGKYRAFLKGRYAPETYRHYEHVAKTMLLHYGGLDAKSAKDYLDRLARECGARTVRLHRSALSNLAAFLGVDLSLEGYKLPRIPKRLPRYLDDKQLPRYLELVRKKVSSPRTRTILLLLPYVGLRVSEICALRREDVQRKGSEWSLRVIGKGDKERTVPLSRSAREILNEYMKNGLIQGPRLFDVSPDAVRDRMRALRKELKLPWLTPHKLRHTFGSSLARKDVHIKKIARLLGHESITTADIYTHVEDDALRESVERIT